MWAKKRCFGAEWVSLWKGAAAPVPGSQIEQNFKQKPIVNVPRKDGERSERVRHDSEVRAGQQILIFIAAQSVSRESLRWNTEQERVICQARFGYVTAKQLHSNVQHHRVLPPT